jgi:hypothetical protein
VIAEHYAAVYALLPAGLQKYKGSVPTEPVYPYVCLWGDSGLESSETLCDTPNDLTIELRLTYAGLSFDAVLITAKRVRAVLNRAVPVVSGWQTGRMVQEVLQNVSVDDDVTIPNIGHPFYSVDGLTLRSTKA